MPIDEVLTEEFASQQQTLALAEGPLQNMTVTCKQCEVTFVFTKGEQRFFPGEIDGATSATPGMQEIDS